MMRRVLLFAAVLALTACVQLQPTAAPTATPQAAAPTLSFSVGAQQLQTSQSRGLAPFLRDGRGQAPGAVGWVSLAPSIASVDADGTVHALAPGSATIVAALASNPTVRASVPITVVGNTSTVQLVISPPSANLAVGERVTLHGEVHLADGTISGDVSWTTSDGTVLAINPTTGEVNGLKEGTATIQAAYSQDQNVRATAAIKVFKDAASKPDATPSAVVFRPGSGVDGFDGSDGWTRDTIIADDVVTALAFADPRVGLAMSTVPLISLNGGASWDRQPAAGLVGAAVNSIAMVDQQTAYGVGNDKAYKTTDGGASWTQIKAFTDPATGQSLPVLQAACVNASTGYVLGAAGQVFKTTDGGTTWGLVKAPVEAEAGFLVLVGAKPWLVGKAGTWGFEGGAWQAGALDLTTTSRGRVSFISAQEGFALSPDGLHHSTDGGRTWPLVSNQVAAQGQAVLGLVAFTDAQHGVVAGGNAAMTTHDGGMTWQRKDLGSYLAANIQSVGAKDFFILGSSPARNGIPMSVIFHFDGR